MLAGINNLVLTYNNTYGEALFKRALVCSWKSIGKIKNPKIYKSSLTEDVGKPDPVQSGWKLDGNYKTTIEGEETVYTTTSASSVINYVGSLEEYNTLECDLRYIEAYAGDGFGGLQINTSNKYYLLDIAPNTPEYPVSRVRKGENNLVRHELAKGEFGEIVHGKWIHLKLILEKDYLIAYVNGIISYKAFDTRNEQLWTKACFCTWYCGLSVKNLKLSYTEKDYKGVGYFDFDFKDDKSIEGFEKEGANLEYKEDSMLVRCTEENSSIISPRIFEAPGSKYSALLTMQNTILVRMKTPNKNGKVRVYYVTSKDEEYNETKSKVFDIKSSNGEFQPYYFNLADTSSMDGYLRGFKIKFLNAKNEEFNIQAITFEREDPTLNYLGEITSCTAKKKRSEVSIEGKVDPKYAGKEVTFVETSVQNYNEEVYFRGNNTLGSAKIEDNGEFSFDFDLYADNYDTTRLSSLFIAHINGQKISKPFKISNYQDFSEKIERFKISGPSVYVSDFGAKGDSYTDDTDAIQAALDYIDNLGGGTVILGGDLSTPYGKRYVATHLKIGSNTEFRIEKGAILWQSSRESDYKYEVTYGHDVDIDGLMWCHAGATVNYPLVFVNEKENVRITGEGEIRMTDVGAEVPDAEYFNGNPTKNVGCAHRIHAIPIVLYHSNHLDVTDITISRSNIWHMYMSFNSDVYVGNVLEKQVGCATSDGFTCTSNKGLILDRCMSYTSDDCIGICTCFDDPRGFMYRPALPGENNACENITLRHNYLWGGFGVSFIPWGTGASNAEYEEIRNVEVFDCVLGGHKSVGCWTDDPFYGRSKTYTYDGTEEDYTAVRDIHFHHNIYLNSVEFYYGNVVLKGTNIIFDDINVPRAKSNDKFMNENFDHVIRSGEGFVDESNFINGLSYWTNSHDENGQTGTEKIQDGYGYSAFIKGNGQISEGLYKDKGHYKVDFDLRSGGGTTYFVVYEPISKKIIHEQKVVNLGNSFKTKSFIFNAEKSATYQIGIRHEGKSSVYIDNAKIEKTRLVELPPEIEEVESGCGGSINSLSFIACFFVFVGLILAVNKKETIKNLIDISNFPFTK